MEVTRVEKHILKPNSKYYSMLDGFCFLSKNLYNHANYVVRQAFINDGIWIRYNDLDKLLKQDTAYPDYRQMPTAQSAQQILKLLDKNWKSFFTSVKDWTKNKDKYLGRPKTPKYKDKKNGRMMLILTNQNCKLVNNGIIKFPKIFKDFTIKTKCSENTKFKNFQQIRILPGYKHFVIEVVYVIDIMERKPDNERYLSIDIGLDNLAAVTTNTGNTPFIINGKGLKSINKYYNRQVSHYRETAKRMNNLDYTNRMNRITQRRNNKMNDYMHKASRYIIEYALKHDINTIVIGSNKGWKQESKMSRKVNQSFVGIPHQRLIEMITYKAESVSINVIITEESYTSGTSFLDNEIPSKDNYNKTRRIYRGLFVSNHNIRINADVNGSYQIMKKVFPNVFTDGIEGVVLHPIRVSVA